MKKQKMNKGITLIALIITIIVLLILAAVAIAAIKGDGIISHAKNAKSEYSGAQANETSTISGYEAYIEDSLPGAVKKVEKNLDKVLSTTDNIPLADKYGNKITVPAGFKIITKTDTENTDLNYTAEDINVTKGIVVEDGEGNQFVWIPVRKIKNAQKTKTINLERNKFGDSSFITLSTVKFENIKLSRLENNYKITSRAADIGGSYSEGKKNETTTNVHAKDIEAFVSKANASGGYYLGRYEARAGTTERKSKTDDLTPVTLKANDYVYNYVTQAQASERCQSMYTNKPFESDLANSYAWDTAIIFFQEFGDNSTYASKTSVNSKFANTGTSGTSYTGTPDKICNVYDMASNCWEWSTETSSDSRYPCTRRGGSCYDSGDYTSYRISNIPTSSDAGYSFRPLLYM